MNSFDIDRFARTTRRALGFQRYWCSGEKADSIASALRSNLLDASAQESVETDVAVWDLRGYGKFYAEKLSRIGEAQIHSAIVIVDLSDLGDDWLSKREELERVIISQGFRKITGYYDFNSYESLNDRSEIFVCAFERVPSGALKDFNLEVLVEERLLHTDMLREVGRRSDAHCIRYYHAAEYVRPGDRVLDVACGLGYGSHILYSNSQAESVLGIDLSDFGIEYANAHYAEGQQVTFRVGDAQDLRGIEDSSIDFIAAFETIEHVPHPEEYLRELERVLTPGGRILICAPNDWTDETGKDPNPHHLHVYDWDRLTAEVSERFLVEKSFAQVAGGAMKCHFSPRSWTEVAEGRPNGEESEWIVLLAMKSPLAPAAAKYEERSWDLPSSGKFNVSAFARDYENPWLVKGLVAIGMRMSNPSILNALRRKVILDYSSETVDYGAALCGLLYSHIEGDRSSDLEALSDLACNYLAIKRPSPHQRRWQISIAYAAGLAHYLCGDTETSKSFLRDCIAIDPIPYSPLVGNKTLDAKYLLSIIHLTAGDISSAREEMLQSVALAKTWATGDWKSFIHRPWLNIVGRLDAPLAFGLAEMAVLFDKASRAAYMLAVIDSENSRPGMFAAQAEGFLERQVVHLSSELGAFVRQNSIKADEILRLNDRQTELAQELRELQIAFDSVCDQSANDLKQKDLNISKLVSELETLQTSFNEVCSESAISIRSRDDRIGELVGELSQLQIMFDKVCEDSADEKQVRDARISELVGEQMALQVAFDTVCKDSAETIAEKDARILELVADQTRLQRAFDTVCEDSAEKIAARDARVSELAGELSQLQKSFDSVCVESASDIQNQIASNGELVRKLGELQVAFDKVCNESRMEIDERDSAIKNLTEDSKNLKAHLKTVTSELASQSSVFETERSRLQSLLDKERSAVTELASEVNRLNKVSEGLGDSIQDLDRTNQRLAQQIQELDAKNRAIADELSAEIESRDQIIARLLEEQR